MRGNCRTCIDWAMDDRRHLCAAAQQCGMEAALLTVVRRCTRAVRRHRLNSKIHEGESNEDRFQSTEQRYTEKGCRRKCQFDAKNIGTTSVREPGCYCTAGFRRRRVQAERRGERYCRDRAADQLLQN